MWKQPPLRPALGVANKNQRGREPNDDRRGEVEVSLSVQIGPVESLKCVSEFLIHTNSPPQLQPLRHANGTL